MIRILAVEDNKADVFLIRQALLEAQIESQLEVLNDGEKAIQFVARADEDISIPVPDLILLDLNLPRKSGVEILDGIRRSRRLGATKVLVVTSSDSERDSQQVFQLGVDGYFKKPSNYAAFMKLGGVIRELLSRSTARL